MIDLSGPVPASGTPYETMAAATDVLEPPFAVVDLSALRANAAALVRRAGGKPVRVASKSVRCREITRAVLGIPGYRGVLALTLPEALWLAGEPGDAFGDVVVAYPSADRAALRRLGSDERLAARVTIMVDSGEQLDLIERVAGADGPPVRVCLELDAALRLAGGRVHLGPRRSPVHGLHDAVVLARAIAARPRFRLVGMMSYEGQIAGVADDAGPLASRLQVRGMQRLSRRELAGRRAEVVAAVRAVAPLEFVNGGGTGSVESTAAEPAVTEVAAGSGLYCPALFDGYRSFSALPAAWFVTSVVRKPSPGMATVLGGGWVASGAPGRDRLPVPSWPTGLRLTRLEGAGEAQTPLCGRGAARLRVGDRVWFRHAKAGELCERVNELNVLDGGRIAATVPTYRGEGHAFL